VNLWIQPPRLSAPGQGINGWGDAQETTSATSGGERRSRSMVGGGKLNAAEAKPLKAPFPYPGGKSRVADYVWSRLGDVDNYVEPFAGSLAVLLRRPADHFRDGYRVETVNDANSYLVNFWRSVKHAPADVAEWADWPVTEADLHARHKWLMRSAEAAEFRRRFAEDPHYCDAKIAGWWAWGQCCWIGSGWCSETGLGWLQRPDVANGSRPQLADTFDIGRGVNGAGNLSVQLPHMDAGCRGQTAAPSVADSLKRPAMKDPGSGNGTTGMLSANWQANTCAARREWLVDWMTRLSDRLRLVRTLCGHWSRPCDSDSTLTRLGTTGVFLDPPYPAVSVNGKKSRDANLYATDKGADLNALRDEVLAWCRKWGQSDGIRIAVCGYEQDGYESLVAEGWEEHEWEASGGYANQRRANKGKAENAKRERIWFSPACIKPVNSAGLFDSLEGAA